MQQKDIRIIKNAVPINQKYIRNVLPYELIVQTLSLQNKQIHELQNQYQSLTQQLKKYQSIQINKASIQNRKHQRIIQRKMFMQQALQLHEKDYQKDFIRRQKNLSQEIQQKRIQTANLKGNSTNVFINFSQGLLDVLLQQNKHTGQQSLIKEINFWKNAYQKNKSSEQREELMTFYCNLADFKQVVLDFNISQIILQVSDQNQMQNQIPQIPKDLQFSQILCQRHNKAQFICVSAFCNSNAFTCRNSSCRCYVNHIKCNMKCIKGLSEKINAKRNKMPQKILEACDELRAIYNDLIDRLSKDRQALTLWEDNYGISQLQYKFIEALQTGNYAQITGQKVFQICQGLRENVQYDWFAKQWVSEKWKQHSSLFYSIFNQLGKPFVGFNFELKQFFPIIACFKTSIYGSGGKDFQFIPKKQGLSLTQVFAEEGYGYLNSIQVAFSNGKSKQVSQHFNQTKIYLDQQDFEAYQQKPKPVKPQLKIKPGKQKIIKKQKQVVKVPQMPKMNENSWIVPQGQYISKVILRSGDWIDGVRFVTNKGTQSPKFGGNGGSQRIFDIPNGYRIIGICGATGNYLRKFGLILGKYFPKKRNYRLFKYDAHSWQEISKRVFIGRSFIPKQL